MWEENLDPEEARGDGEQEQGYKQVFVNTDSCHLKGSKIQICKLKLECFKHIKLKYPPVYMKNESHLFSEKMVNELALLLRWTEVTFFVQIRLYV